MPLSDVDLLLNWQTWPMYPVCPVKNRERRDGGMPACGIVVAWEMQNRGEGHSPDPFHVYHKNLYDLETGSLKPQLEGVNKDAFNSIEEMLEAGWVVD